MDVPPSSRIPTLAWIAIPLVSVVVLLPSLWHGFYQDDFTWLIHSQETRGDLTHVLDSWIGAFKRPVGQFWFYAQYRIFGLRPVLFNATSFILHATAALLVVALARRRGHRPSVAVMSGLLFGLGVGHGDKPVLWACSQPILLGTLALLLCLWVLSSVRGPGRWWAILLLSLAVTSHDVFVLAPFGIALVVWQDSRDDGGARHRILLTLLSVMIGLVQIGLTVQARAAMMESSPPSIFMVTNFLQYLASLLAPLTSLRVPGEMLQRVGLDALFPVVRVLVWGLGALTGVLLVRAARNRTGETSYVLLGALLVLPATLPRSGGPDWVEARYFYPAIALWAPTLAGELLQGASASQRFGSAPVLRKVALAVILAGGLLGSAYMQKQAAENGKAGHQTPRWTEIREHERELQE